MASISSPGAGSGLDIGGIVQQLVAAEGQPLETRLVQKEARAQGKLSGFGSLKSSLAALRDKLDVMKSQDKFLSRTASSGNEDYFTATAGEAALPSSYAVEVVRLAQAQKLTSGAFADAAAVVGTGTLTVAVGAVAMTLDITAENNSLDGIRDAINAATDNPGVSATIVNADSGSYLIVTAESTGLANTITITQSGGDGGLSALEYDPANSLMSLTESIAPQDALIRIDGLDVMNSSNTFAAAVEGVTIDVIQETGGVQESLTIANDKAATRKLVSDFVDSYNLLISTIDNLTAYDAENETAAPLIGDSTVRGIRDQIRRELSTAVEDLDAPFSTLAEIGVETQLDGKLSIDDETLDAVLQDDFVKLGQLFSTTDGYATRLFSLADGFLESDGILETRTQGLTSTIESYSDDREALNDRLVALETRLLKQFNALDSLLSQLSTTGNFLSQQLNNLPGVGSSNGS